jgi:hypothetical protein
MERRRVQSNAKEGKEIIEGKRNAVVRVQKNAKEGREIQRKAKECSITQ